MGTGPSADHTGNGMMKAFICSSFRLLRYYRQVHVYLACDSGYDNSNNDNDNKIKKNVSYCSANLPLDTLQSVFYLSRDVSRNNLMFP